VSSNLNHEQQFGPSQEPLAATEVGRISYHRKAARVSLIGPSFCWAALLVVSVLEQDLRGVTQIYGILWLVSCASFLAGFVGLFGGKHAEVGMSLLGIFLSGSFCYFDFMVTVSSALGLGVADWF
jgi:hypothetical protein